METRINRLISFLENDPDDSFTIFALGLEYLKISEFQKAKQLFEQIVTHDPDYVGVYYHLGKLHEFLNDEVKAKIIYSDGIAVAKRIKDFHSLNELQQALDDIVL